MSEVEGRMCTHLCETDVHTLVRNTPAITSSSNINKIIDDKKMN
jgi:hypothetical protein